MRIAILTANLGNFDSKNIDPVKQETKHEIVFHRFTDENFPPITGLSSRFQYRIPKLFGWQMFTGYDYYIWLDGSVTFKRSDCVEWYLDQIGDNDMAFFKHPSRNTIKEEVDHIEDHLKKGKPYITSRYKNGLHKEQLKYILGDYHYEDNVLYASTAFIYRNNEISIGTMAKWWSWQSRYYTCDQVALPYAIYLTGAKVKKINEHLFKSDYLSLFTHHK